MLYNVVVELPISEFYHFKKESGPIFISKSMDETGFTYPKFIGLYQELHHQTTLYI